MQKNPLPMCQARVLYCFFQQSPKPSRDATGYGWYPGFRIFLLTAPSRTTFYLYPLKAPIKNSTMDFAAFIPGYSGGSAAAQPHSHCHNQYGKEPFQIENKRIHQKVKYKKCYMDGVNSPPLSHNINHTCLK